MLVCVKDLLCLANSQSVASQSSWSAVHILRNKHFLNVNTEVMIDIIIDINGPNLKTEMKWKWITNTFIYKYIKA